jgi:hypothetical protein
MDAFQLLEDAGSVTPADEIAIEAAVELVLAAAFQEASAAEVASSTRPHAVLRRRLFAGGAVLATAAAAAAVTVAALLPGGGVTRPPTGRPAPGSNAPRLLTAAMIQHISSSSSEALARSGTAEVTTTSTFGSLVQPADTTAVTFSGQDVNYSISTGPAPNDTAINRIVDGQLYLYIIGPDLQKHWYHDTAPDAAVSLAFPDPRTLIEDLTPQAGFEVAGQASVNGVELTHLRATNLSGLGRAALGGYVNGTVSSFDVWVDSDNVAEKIAITSSTEGYAFSGAPPGHNASCPSGNFVLKKSDGSTQTVPAQKALGCSPPTAIRSSTEIEFANLGTPETITAPAGAIDQQGLG